MTDLTNEQIDSMPAGCEMDALVADRVMQWQHIDWWMGSLLAKGWDGFWDGEWVRWITIPESDADDRAEPWSPSTDIMAAWQVIEKMREGYSISIHTIGSIWQCTLEIKDHKTRFPVEVAHAGDAFADADTAPLAICRATLMAVRDNVSR